MRSHCIEFRLVSMLRSLRGPTPLCRFSIPQKSHTLPKQASWGRQPVRCQYSTAKAANLRPRLSGNASGANFMLAAAGGSLVTALLIFSLRGQQANGDAEYEKYGINQHNKSKHVYASNEEMSKVRGCNIANISTYTNAAPRQLRRSEKNLEKTASALMMTI